MKKSKLLIPIIIFAFWISAFGIFIGYKEFTIRRGTEVILETRPIDPRDLFRGDYVVLNYEINRIARPENFPISLGRDDDIYILLDLGEDGVAEYSGFSESRPQDGLFIKGKLNAITSSTLIVQYGIESYFVPEDRGLEIERTRGEVQGIVSIGSGGNAVLTDILIDGKIVEF